MTTDDLTTARLDMPVADVVAGVARVVHASEIAPVLDQLHDRLTVCTRDAAHDVQVHEFLDIDPDIADRDYPPMPWARKAIPGLYPDTSSTANFAASSAAGYVTPAYGDCEPVFATRPDRTVTDVQTGDVL